jgi:hypothetical protein
LDLLIEFDLKQSPPERLWSNLIPSHLIRLEVGDKPRCCVIGVGLKCRRRGGSVMSTALTPSAAASVDVAAAAAAVAVVAAPAAAAVTADSMQDWVAVPPRHKPLLLT